MLFEFARVNTKESYNFLVSKVFWSKLSGKCLLLDSFQIDETQGLNSMDANAIAISLFLCKVLLSKLQEIGFFRHKQLQV